MDYKKKHNWRYRLYELVDYVDTTGDGRKNIDYYDYFMILVIIVSIIPLLFKEETPFLLLLDLITVIIFIIDYILRWITADYRMGETGIMPFLKHPFTFMAIVDYISILPSFSLLNPSFKLLRIFRIFRSLRVARTVKVVRVLKVTRYSRSFAIIVDVLKNSKDALLAVISLSTIYIFVSALIIFNVEPDSFGNFFEAIYWATVSLTTVGYGDLYPVTTVGRIVAMVSSIFGIAIVALPAGIITAGYMRELQKETNQDD